MSLSRDSYSERLLKFHLRHLFRYKQGRERIEFEEKVLLPEILKLKAGKSVLNLPEGAMLDDIEVRFDDAHSDQGPIAGARAADDAPAAQAPRRRPKKARP